MRRDDALKVLEYLRPGAYVVKAGEIDRVTVAAVKFDRGHRADACLRAPYAAKISVRNL
jgi:hypothetical protein